MLFSSGSDIIRLQCPFVDTPEIERICEQIKIKGGMFRHIYYRSILMKMKNKLQILILPIEIRYLKMPQGLLLHLKLEVHHYCKEN